MKSAISFFVRAWQATLDSGFFKGRLDLLNTLTKLYHPNNSAWWLKSTVYHWRPANKVRMPNSYAAWMQQPEWNFVFRHIFYHFSSKSCLVGGGNRTTRRKPLPNPKSQMLRSGFETGQWWVRASSEWQHLRLLGDQDRPLSPNASPLIFQIRGED